MSGGAKIIHRSPIFSIGALIGGAAGRGGRIEIAGVIHRRCRATGTPRLTPARAGR